VRSAAFSAPRRLLVIRFGVRCALYRTVVRIRDRGRQRDVGAFFLGLV
jgi:ribosomal protein S26